MRALPGIPTHTISQVDKEGIFVRYFDETIADRHYLQLVHRDDFYLLVYQERGSSGLFVDFQEISFEGPSLFIILPGQMHYGLSSQQSAVFLLAVNPSLINEQYQSLFHLAMGSIRPMPLTPSLAALLKQNIQLIQHTTESKNELPFYNKNIRHLTESCLSIFASVYYKEKHSQHSRGTRMIDISRQFISLLMQHFRTIKSPAAYADMLHITTDYLNEAVKAATGKTVSRWIQETVVTEAKRQLFHTTLNIDEIAGQLGYEDYRYFTRLFKKAASISPQQFRTQYSREKDA
ncbi:AraC family transcriptional regulator [Chitinophaga pinensis]|uniref:Transcriptional regulator, AraC family n=1 Tax=Chitinophaga pinensis (strain ATCC 43595 / DSM 2588 / LMG 13176 / NBRC 15968 / NCIMB 11800 / UQM 2034) TaxID=485918 RepID=A0A979G522_CHIPD|nr:AraC family transcriptional regulator [Chitinophaga pinensis]ACU60850.1 transcriptional regulator, AraC family [Chitinophaga pinensis DSM 2588]